MTFIYGELAEGGKKFFFNIKKGAKSFFGAKKGGANFFWEKKGGLRVFSGRKKGGKTFFTGLKFPKPGLGTRQILVVPLDIC